MRKTVKKTVPAHEWWGEDVRCDLCGAKRHDNGEWPGVAAPREVWDGHDARVEVYLETRWSEGPAEQYDVCVACWHEKLVPFLRSQMVGRSS